MNNQEAGHELAVLLGHVEPSKPANNRQLIEQGTATDQQLDLEVAVAALSVELDNVPSNVIHYAVEDLRRAVAQYYRSPVITTKDAQ